MKKKLLISALALISLNIVAQDFGVDSISIRTKVDTGWQKITNDTVFTNETVYLGVYLKNYAGGPISKGDSVGFGITVNKIPLPGSYGGIVNKTIIPNSGTLSFTEIIIKKDQTFPIAASDVEVCAWPNYWSKGGLGGATNNDTICAKYTIWDKAITIKSFQPEEGIAGVTDVTIKGNYFGDKVADNVVKFGDKIATIKSATENEIVATISKTAVTGKITIESNGLIGTSSSDFTVKDDNGNVVYPLTILENKASLPTLNYYNQKIYLSTDNQKSNRLSVISLSGKTILEKDIPQLNKTQEIDVSHFEQGIYIVRYGNSFLKFSK